MSPKLDGDPEVLRLVLGDLRLGIGEPPFSSRKFLQSIQIRTGI